MPPQEDYSVANQAGAAFRTDLNNQLAAIVTNNSGATAPAVTFAFMWWVDTTDGILKQRNAANSAWIAVMTLAGITAANIANVSAGNIVATTVQAALNELDAKKANLTGAGEYVASITGAGSAIALTSNVAVDITSITLPAGDWDVSGNVTITSGTDTSVALFRCGSSTLSGGIIPENSSGFSDYSGTILRTAATGSPIIGFPTARFNLPTGGIVYLVSYALFTVAALSVNGRISARRVA